MSRIWAGVDAGKAHHHYCWIQARRSTCTASISRSQPGAAGA
ncbi:hypothetical protein [Streptomyces sp. HC307]